MKLFLTSLLLILSTLLFAQDKVYFTNQDQLTVEFSDLDGGNLQNIISGHTVLRRIRVDQKNEHVYWVEAGTGTLWQSDLDGGNKTAFLTASSNLAVFEIDTLNSRILYTESGDNTIRSIGLDNQNDQVLISGSGLVLGMDYDPINDVIYWTDFSGERILKANGDGSDVTTLYPNAGQAFGIALDVENQILYYSNRQTNQVHTISTAGVEIGTVTTASTVTIGDISLDVTNERLYWIEGEPFVIKSADFDGNNTLLIAANISAYAGLDVAPTPAPIIATFSPNQNTKISLYPNPTSELLSINLDNSYLGTVKINIYNKEGKIVLQEKADKTTKIFTNKINVQQYPSGIYFLQLQIGKETITKRFINIFEPSRA